jgi:SSS family solute:Na+ symporter
VLGHIIYIAIAAFVLNLAIAIIGTLIFRALKFPDGADETLPHQYVADPAPATAAQVPAAAGAAAGAGGGHEGPPIS